jgi:hypothetical protein
MRNESIVFSRLLKAMTIAVALVVVAGCGGSSKPAYCTDRSNLQSSVQGLKSAASSRDVDGLKSSATKVQSDATSLVNAAKGDFPTETSAVKSSVDTLKGAVNALPASPSAQDLAPIATGAESVVTSVQTFSDASKSKCS